MVFVLYAHENWEPVDISISDHERILFVIGCAGHDFEVAGYSLEFF